MAFEIFVSFFETGDEENEENREERRSRTESGNTRNEGENAHAKQEDVRCLFVLLLEEEGEEGEESVAGGLDAVVRVFEGFVSRVVV